MGWTAHAPARGEMSIWVMDLVTYHKSRVDLVRVLRPEVAPLLTPFAKAIPYRVRRLGINDQSRQFWFSRPQQVVLGRLYLS